MKKSVYFFYCDVTKNISLISTDNHNCFNFPPPLYCNRLLAIALYNLPVVQLQKPIVQRAGCSTNSGLSQYFLQLP